MTPDRLLDHFDRISAAPDTIPHLRRFILDLAVRGKLIEQDPNDEPASALLNRIHAEKVQMIREGNATKEPKLPPIDENEAPFDLPRGWTWARFPEVGIFGRGKSKHRPRNDASLFEGGTHLFVQTGDVARSNGVIETYTNKYNDIGLAQSAKWPKGTLCITIAANIADSGILSFDACFPDSVVGFIPASLFPSARYFEYFIRTAKADLLVFAPATAQKNINLGILNAVLIPLPPLAEQHRIVAKADELMALCDRLEAAQAERESRRDRLVAVSLHRLNNGADADEFRQNARFHFYHLPRLTTRPEHIQQLRQTILNLAVRGKLVPQDPRDEPASKLLKRIGVEISDEQPFRIPDSWTWVSVGQIGDSRLGKMLDKAKNKGTPRRYLRNVNVRWFGFDLSDVFEMRFEDAELEEFALRDSDVLICEGGEPGRAAVWDEREKDIYFQKAIHRVRFSERVDPHFFVNAVRESADSGRLSNYFTGVGIKHFTGKGLSSFVFPLPPVAEQHRIVTIRAT